MLYSIYISVVFKIIYKSRLLIKMGGYLIEPVLKFIRKGICKKNKVNLLKKTKKKWLLLIHICLSFPTARHNIWHSQSKEKRSNWSIFYSKIGGSKAGDRHEDAKLLNSWQPGSTAGEQWQTGTDS